MYHFIGIKEAGMSALAIMLKDLGYEVSGSDIDEHFFAEEKFVEKGIKLSSYNEMNILENMKIIKASSINDDNCELLKATELGLKIYDYSQMLGHLTRKFKTIGISGCHGKTITTSMMAHVLNNLKSCNYLIGDGNGYVSKGSEYFAIEASEYKRNFLEYSPYYAVITNIDFEHIDYFNDIDDVVMAFQEYASKAEKMVIAYGDDPYTHLLEVNVPIFYYGLEEDNDIIATNIEYKETGTSFEVTIEGNYYGYFDLPIYGKHMLLNALAVIAVCYYERIEAKELSKVLKTFKGRFEEISVLDNVIIDDYAHHPTEIKATIKAAKQKYPDKDIIAVYVPYTYSRTKEFASDLISVLKNVDKVYVMDIYSKFEKQEDYPDITSDIILKELSNGEYITLDGAHKLKDIKNSVILFMSPNDLSDFEKEVIEVLENRE